MLSDRGFDCNCAELFCVALRDDKDDIEDVAERDGVACVARVSSKPRLLCVLTDVDALGLRELIDLAC